MPKFLTSIDLSQNELKKARIENYAGNPNGSVSGVEGQILWDSTNDALYLCTGTTVWVAAGSDTNTTYDISSVSTTGGAFLRLTAGGSGSGTDDVKFASGTNTTVAYTDVNTITISATDTDTATATDDILDGSNVGTAIKYMPYAAQQASLTFDTSATTPTLTGRLNLNGRFYATDMYTNSITGFTTLLIDSATTSALNIGTGSNAKTITIGNNTTSTAVDIITGSGNLDITTPLATISGDLTVTGGDIKTGAAVASTLWSDTTTGNIAIAGALSTGTYTVGATGSTGAVSLFPATGSQAITLGGATTGIITIGSTSASAVQLPTGKTKVGQTILTQGDAQTYTFPSSGAGATLIASSGTQTIANGLTITTPVIDDIKASAVGATTDLWSEQTTGNSTQNSGQTSGTIIWGGAAGTGAITLAPSTKAQTINIANGATESGLTKAVNIGTGGLAASTSTNIIIGPAAGPDTITIGQSTVAETINIGTGSTGSAVTRTVNIGTVSAGSSINNINIGGGSGTTSIKLPSLGTSGVVTVGTGGLLSATSTIANPVIDNIQASAASVAADLWSEVTTGSIAIGAGLTSGSLTLGAGTGNTTVSNNLVVTGNMTVNGTTTTINSTVQTFDDPIITLGGDTSTVEVTKDRGVEAKWNGTTLTMTNYIGAGTTTVTGTVASTTGYAAGDIITIAGATGTEQAKLNGTWTLASVPTGATFTFVVSQTVGAGTLTTNLGTTVKSKDAFFGLDQSTGKFTFIPQANNVSEVFSGTKGTIDAYVEWADINSKPTILAKYAVDLTASATSYVITHNLNTRDAVVSVYEIATPWAQVMCDVEFTSVNTITLRFAVAPTGSTYRVAVIG